MSCPVIYFYDCGVLAGIDNTIVVNSPSYALIEPKGNITVGEEAKQQAYLRPREISTHFWNQLSEQSMTKISISHAELALHHLKHIWQQAEFASNEAILITPSSMRKQDLGLLLGVCKKLDISVTGLVSGAVLASHLMSSEIQAAYIDLQQQQVCITEFQYKDTTVSVQSPFTILPYGFDHIKENCAHTIAQKFIKDTRYDPLHNANDEQQFYDKLSLWLEHLKHKQTIECSLSSNNKTFTIELDQQDLSSTNKNIFDEIAVRLMGHFQNKEQLVIYCSPTCEFAYYLIDFLKQLPGCAVQQVIHLDIIDSALLYSEQIQSSEDNVQYITSLNKKESNAISDLDFSSGSFTSLCNLPTHILINQTAYLLKDELFITEDENKKQLNVVSSNNIHALCRITVNNMKVEIENINGASIRLNDDPLQTTTTAHLGDQLTMQNHKAKLQFIRVKEV